VASFEGRKHGTLQRLRRIKKREGLTRESSSRVTCPCHGSRPKFDLRPAKKKHFWGKRTHRKSFFSVDPEKQNHPPQPLKKKKKKDPLVSTIKGDISQYPQEPHPFHPWALYPTNGEKVDIGQPGKKALPKKGVPTKATDATKAELLYRCGKKNSYDNSKRERTLDQSYSPRGVKMKSLTRWWR